MFREQGPELLPDIEEYLESVDENAPVSPKGLDELIYKVRASTGLSKDTCSILITLFFQEIRNQMLRGNIISLKGFGKFLIAKRSKKIFPKFKPSKWLKNKLNGN